MAYNQQLAARIRKALTHVPGVQEQPKMGGITFMLRGKFCVRAHSNGDMMLRCDPKMTEPFLSKNGVRRFTMKGRSAMQGWLLISSEGTESRKDFDFWVKTALDFNAKIVTKQT